MKKSYFFGLALLFGATTGYAQKNIASLADLKEVKTGLESLDDWKEEYNERNTLINSLDAQYSGMESTTQKQRTVVYKYGTTLATAIKAFDEGSRIAGDQSALTFAVEKIGSTTTSAPQQRVRAEAYILHIYENETVASQIDNREHYTVIGSETDETSKLITKGNNISKVRFYYSDKKYEVKIDTDGKRTETEISSYVSTYSNKEVGLTTASTLDDAIFGVLTSVINTIPADKETVELYDEKNTAKEELAARLLELRTLNSTLKTKIDAVATYKELNLTQSFTISSEDAAFTLALPAGSTFKGGNNTITGSQNSVSLFSTNGGTISNVNVSNLPLVGTNNGIISSVIGDNCNIVNRNNGDISNVTVTNGRVTVEKGTNSHIINSLDDLNRESSVYGSDASFATVKADDASTYYNIYNNKTLRNEFGVAVGTGIVSKGSNNKLYEVTMYHAGNKTGEKRLANIDGNGKPVIKRAWTTTGVGEFYYISDTDAGSLFDGITGDNIAKNVVYTHDGSNWECKVAEVSNGANSIYIPRAFTAATVKYDRNFNVSAQNASTICLPFAVDESIVNSALGTNGHLLQFNKIDENGQTYWFKYVTGGIEANQPYVLLFGQNVNSKFFDGLSNVKFAATGESQDLKALSQSSVAAGASLYGTFEKRTASELEDGAKHSIYGFQNGQFVRMTDAVNFNATRAYVRNDKWTEPKAPNAAKAYKLGILDENGNEVTGISSVENAADEFTVNGGNGAISINADKAQNVKVYTVGGALVKSVDVEAGATSLPVSAGMYIVNGNKVVVK